MVLDGFWEETRPTQSKEFNPYHAGFLQLVAVSETDGQAEEYKESIEYFFKKCLHIHSGFGNPPGYRSVRSNNSQVSNSTTQSREDQLKEFTWTDYLEAGNVIVGGPETVREHLAHAIKELRVGNLMLLLQFGDMPKELAMKNTELFSPRGDALRPRHLVGVRDPLVARGRLQPQRHRAGNGGVEFFFPMEFADKFNNGGRQECRPLKKS